MFASAVPSFPSLPLADLGWDDAWAATLATAVQILGPADPARVARVDLGACTVLGAAGAGRATVPPGTTVTVGDWVLVRDGVVVGALPRRTAIVRRSAGADARAQTLAANVDTVLVLVASDGRVTPRSVERYVTLVWESGALPVVVLTKADLVSGAELEDAVERLDPASAGVDLVIISVPTGAGLDDLTPYFGRGRTVALLGSSGAGKSTLANHLTGADLATGAVRDGDRRGRHTTTHRELVPLPGGGVLIDSPGLREVGLWQAQSPPSPASAASATAPTGASPAVPSWRRWPKGGSPSTGWPAGASSAASSTGWPPATTRHCGSSSAPNNGGSTGSTPRPASSGGDTDEPAPGVRGRPPGPRHHRPVGGSRPPD